MSSCDLGHTRRLSGNARATAVTAPANINTLQVPQLIENYKSGSADGISLVFLAIWFIGDVTNLFGALWAGLVPTVIALAMYFCVADLVRQGLPLLKLTHTC